MSQGTTRERNRAVAGLSTVSSGGWWRYAVSLLLGDRDPQKRQSHLNFLFVLLPLWASAAATFTVPTKEISDGTGSIDILGLYKIAVRLVICGVLGLILLRTCFRGTRTAQHMRTILVRNWAWGAFVAWSFLSVFWSPLRVVSGGQVVGLIALSLLMLEIARRTYTCGMRDTAAMYRFVQLLIRNVIWMLFLCSAVVVSMHIYRPEWSGLDRLLTENGYTGLAHPTAAGATASIGVALLWLAHMIGVVRVHWALR
ncbi:MAG: hypothetical protein AAFP69_12645, partial [Planctomycetota bacterium]